MSRQARAFLMIGAAVAAVLVPSGARAGLSFPNDKQETHTADLPLTTTDFQTSSSKTVAPLVFQQFDTQNNTRTLDAVVLTFSAQITNNFWMTFVGPATITDSAIGPQGQLPTITMYQPDGVHSLLTTTPSDPSTLTKAISYGGPASPSSPTSFGPDLTDPKFVIAPVVTQASNSLTLTAASDLALFTGPNALSLPLSASAFARSTSDSGNGSGRVTTQAQAHVTVTYEWSPSSPAQETIPPPTGGGGGGINPPPGGGGVNPPPTVPEPAAVVLWGIGGATLLAAHRVRRRRSA